MNVLVALSANSNICISSEFVSLDRSPCFVILSFFTCLFIFDWVLDIAIFTFLGAGYFCIPKSILWISSQMKLSNVKTVCFFLVFLLRSVSQTRVAFTLGLIIPYYLIKTLWIYSYPMYCKIFLVCFMGKDTIYSPVWTLGSICSNPFIWFFPQQQVVF